MNVEMKVFRVSGILYLDFYSVNNECEDSGRNKYIIEFKVKNKKVILEKCLNVEYLQYCEIKAKEFVKKNRNFI